LEVVLVLHFVVFSHGFRTAVFHGQSPPGRI
jgi:hypothetical protein